MNKSSISDYVVSEDAYCVHKLFISSTIEFEECVLRTRVSEPFVDEFDVVVQGKTFHKR